MRGATDRGVSITERYDANYQRIAADHVNHWHQTGNNPFQPQTLMVEQENLTVDAIQRHAPAGATILDAGCAMGDLLLRLGDYRAYGCDIAAPYLGVANKRGLKVTLANIEDMPYRTGSFDVVVAADVLEHVLDLNAAVRELVRVLRPTGTLIVRVPTLDDVDVVVGDYEFVHLRYLDEGLLRTLLTEFALRVVEVERTESCSELQVVARP